MNHNNYLKFAYVYDQVMQNIPYRTMKENICKIFEINNLNPQLMLDLCCGTGTITEMFALDGIEMIGIDSSDSMLNEAFNKKYGNNTNTLYLKQNATNFELYGTVDAIISTCDSINYIIEHDELLSVFKHAENYLNKDGLFIFDLKTLYSYKEIFADNVFTYKSEDVYYFWENSYSEDDRLNIYTINFFVKEENGLYSHFEEKHTQRAYTQAEIEDLVKESGLELIDVLDFETLKQANNFTTRAVYIAKCVNAKKKFE